MGCSLRQRGESRAGELPYLPIPHLGGADFLVEVDGRLVPVQDVPFDQQALFRQGAGGEVTQQSQPQPGTAMRGLNEQVFQEDAPPTGEGEHLVVEQSDAGGRGVFVIDQNRISGWVRSEQHRVQIGFGRGETVQDPFVVREAADQAQHVGDIGWGCVADGHRTLARFPPPRLPSSPGQARG